ncbi:MAG: hypothetical protein AABX28_00050 [Nanoarchaeota archaeon]
MNLEIFKQITKKKEFSQLPKKDVELAFSHFEKRQCSDEEKIRLTRDLLRKVFSAFTSGKLLSLKNKNPEWILRKHLSTRERMNVQRSSKDSQTRERLPYYNDIYKRIFSDFKKEKEISVIDLGAGVNGFSYEFFDKIGFVVNYLGIESVGQLTDLMNFYFKREKIKNANATHLSLFELEKVKEIIKKTKKPRIVFLFKVIDSLEMLERDYSKKLLSEIVPLADKIVVSFATRSMIKRKQFFAKRNWIVDFIKENFGVLDDFEIGSERYLVFKK